MKIPRYFYRLHEFFTLAADVMFVHSIPSLVNFSRKIRLITVEHVPTSTAVQLAKSLMNIIKLYARGRLVIRLFLMDMEFEKIKDKVGLVEINTTAAREHVGEIERQICLIKERKRCSTSYMLDCGMIYLPKQIVIHLVYNVCLWMNAFLLKSGLSVDYPPS